MTKEQKLAAKQRALEKACQIIETADTRLTTLDGPCGGQPPDMTLDEWKDLYGTLDRARKL